jgi:methyltransferase-like protein
MLALCGAAPAPEPRDSGNAALKEILECSMIRMAEQFHILENIDRTSKDQKIRAWIIKRIEHGLYMMETVELTKNQRKFVREMREHLTGQK